MILLMSSIRRTSLNLCAHITFHRYRFAIKKLNAQRCNLGENCAVFNQNRVNLTSKMILNTTNLGTHCIKLSVDFEVKLFPVLAFCLKLFWILSWISSGEINCFAK